jgi:hypothetical protein
MPVIKSYDSNGGIWTPIAAGATGPTGPQGVLGSTGPTGPQGVTGPQGDWSTAQVVSTQSTSFTVALTDAGKILKCDSGAAFVATIPTDAAVLFSIGQKIDFLQYGAGQLTVEGDTGVTVRSTPTNKLRTQYSVASAIKIAENEWILVGDLALV